MSDERQQEKVRRLRSALDALPDSLPLKAVSFGGISGSLDSTVFDGIGVLPSGPGAEAVFAHIPPMTREIYGPDVVGMPNRP